MRRPPNCRCLRSVRTAPMRRSLPALPTGSEAGSSSGEGSPWAEQEVLAGSPAGRTLTITKPPEVVVSRAGDLTPGAPVDSAPPGPGTDQPGSGSWAIGRRAACGPHPPSLSEGTSNSAGRMDIAHQEDSSQPKESTASWRRRPTVTDFRHMAGVSSESTLRLMRSDPMSDEGEISFETTAPPVMTTDLAIALSHLVRATLARRAEQPKRVA